MAEARDAAEDGRFAEATEAYQRVIAASPDSGFLHVELGRVDLHGVRMGEEVQPNARIPRIEPHRLFQAIDRLLRPRRIT